MLPKRPMPLKQYHHFQSFAVISSSAAAAVKSTFSRIALDYRRFPFNIEASFTDKVRRVLCGEQQYSFSLGNDHSTTLAIR